MISIENIKRNYKNLSTERLKEVANSFETIEKEYLPILLQELSDRGEQQFVTDTKQKIEAYKSAKKQAYSQESSGDTTKNDDSENIEREPNALNQKLITEALEFLVLNRKKIENWEDCMKRLNSKFQNKSDNKEFKIDKHHEEFLKNQLKTKKRKANQLATRILFMLIVLQIIIFMGTEGRIFWLDSILFLIVIFSIYMRAANFKRLIS